MPVLGHALVLLHVIRSLRITTSPAEFVNHCALAVTIAGSLHDVIETVNAMSTRSAPNVSVPAPSVTPRSVTGLASWYVPPEGVGAQAQRAVTRAARAARRRVMGDETTNAPCGVKEM